MAEHDAIADLAAGIGALAGHIDAQIWLRDEADARRVPCLLPAPYLFVPEAVERVSGARAAQEKYAAIDG